MQIHTFIWIGSTVCIILRQCFSKSFFCTHTHAPIHSSVLVGWFNSLTLQPNIYIQKYMDTFTDVHTRAQTFTNINSYNSILVVYLIVMNISLKSIPICPYSHVNVVCMYISVFMCLHFDMYNSVYTLKKTLCKIKYICLKFSYDLCFDNYLFNLC